VQRPAAFWRAVWDYFDFASPDRPDRTVEPLSLPGARWFPGVRVNYAEQVRRVDPALLAVIACDERGTTERLDYGQLCLRVERCRAGLAQLGVSMGDRVVGYLPNRVEAVVAFLATASLGAVWSSCPPEFGVQSVLDRFTQIEPKVLIAVESYRYGGRDYPRHAEVLAIRAGLPTLEAYVRVDTGASYSEANLAPGGGAAIQPEIEFAELCDANAVESREVQWVDFEHPLWILYSSGTTGKPKAIVHGHGGILLEHTKALALHGDIGPTDRFFWYSTTGWMMWNYMLGGLLLGASIVLYDGSPAEPDLGALWRLVERERVSVFGVSAPYLMTCRDRGLVPQQFADLSSLRVVGSTGAPLPQEGFEWVYANVSRDVALASISGGTDLCTAFVTCCPWLPVRSGELQCRALGAAVDAFDGAGEPLIGEAAGELGELVIRQPMPSMPIGFWADPGGVRYHDAYFAHYPGVWRHGDWIRFFDDGAAVISGRSDATLNRGGVRMGTAEFYRVVEALPEVTDSLVVEVERPGRPSSLVLFLVLGEGQELDEPLELRIRGTIKEGLSPRHVPNAVVQIGAVPYTLSGKKLELPVKRALSGVPIASVASSGTLRNPEALTALLERYQSRSSD
jgi:acetoacetyl-CoA synthetase